MILILILIFFLVLFFAFIAFIAYLESKRHGTKTAEEFSGICNVSALKSSEKENNINKVVSLLEEKSEVSNSEIRKTLGVSSMTAVRYMNELESEGRVEQVGKTGRSVIYRLKK